MVKKAENMTKAELVKLQSDLEKEKREMEQRIAELEKAAQSPQEVPVVTVESTIDEEFSMRPDAYIKVISLCPHPLNLKTANFGGKRFRFRQLGDEKRIMYSDLVDILETQPTFAESGVFYIANEKVVRRHGLDDFYDKIITKDEINDVMTGSSDKAFLIFKSANEKQKLYLSEMLIKKIVAGEEVDMNFVYMAGQELGIDLALEAEDSKDFKDALIEQK